MPVVFQVNENADIYWENFQSKNENNHYKIDLESKDAFVPNAMCHFAILDALWHLNLCCHLWPKCVHLNFLLGMIIGLCNVILYVVCKRKM